ncbi:MAG: PEP/pyruvate-binding domain-containing protein [Candidatus Geothermarchaeales archaeon]
MEKDLIVDITSPSATDGRLTGGKGSGLAKLIRIVGEGNVPYAKVVTTNFSKKLFKNEEIINLVKDLDRKLEEGDEEEAEVIAKEIRKNIESLSLPKDLLDALKHSVEDFKKRGLKNRVAIRSSGVAEDLPAAAFAGQYETFLNVSLDDDLTTYILKCIGSAFGWRVVDYRRNLRERGLLKKSELELMREGLIAVIIQTMVDAEKAGVAFSIDPDTGNKNVGVIQAIYGLGELIVQGSENASWTAFTKRPGVKVLGTIPPIDPQRNMLVYDPVAQENRIIPPSEHDPRVLTRGEAARLAGFVTKIEESNGLPMDVEFAIEEGKVYVTQARPESVHAFRVALTLYKLKEEPKEPPLYTGIAVGTKIASGIIVKVADHVEAREKTGEYNKRGLKPVLVTSMTTPDWEAVMSLEKVSAILCERGNRTSHAAIVSRERGIPCAVGVNGVLGLEEGRTITLDCTTGEARIYGGELPYEVQEVELREIPETSTDVLVNIGSPHEALKVSQLPSGGSSLVRIEFIVSSTGLHPVFALNADRIGHDRWAEDVKEKFPIGGFITSLADEYVERLKTGIAIVAAAFYPRKIIVRFSDFKTNEYGSLTGAVYYEIWCECGVSISLKERKRCPICGSKDVESKKIDLEFYEENPMLGFRGASRYIHRSFKDAFNLELEAFTRVHKLGLKNAVPMVPFVRTLEEAREVNELIISAFKKASLEQPEIIFMAEVPSIFLIPREFSKYCDGFSIGSNDLTQLTLGIDRDCEILAREFNEADPAVTKAIEMLCEGAHSMEPVRTVGICGQAPSDLGRDFIKFLTIHLDSIGVNPDKVAETLVTVKEIEDELRKSFEECNHSHEELSKKLGITENNARYLLKKLVDAPNQKIESSIIFPS